MLPMLAAGNRLVVIAKKKGPAPRPVRVGELWRRMIAKFLLHKCSAQVKQRMLEANQFGVALPGGAEVLIHTRSLLEECIQDDAAAGVWAVIDVDFVNAFPSFEHDAIDAAMAKHVPELQAWSKWCQVHTGDIHLPCGDSHRAHRGAEQGDPLGSLQCGAVLADVVTEATA